MNVASPQQRGPPNTAHAHPEISLQEAIATKELAGKDWTQEIKLIPGSTISCTFDGEYEELVHQRKNERLLKKKYTWRSYLLRLIPCSVVGILGGLAWRWVTLGWRSWARTPQEEALWCRSKGYESLWL
jgi:hypothetical protein